MGKRNKKPRNKRLGPQNPAAREAFIKANPVPTPRPKPKQRALPPQRRTADYDLGRNPDLQEFLAELEEEARAERAAERATLRAEVGRPTIGHPLFRYGRAKEGLGLHAEWVFRSVPEVGNPGVDFDTVAARTPYTPKTVLKYLNSMRGLGLLEERDGLWCRTSLSLDEAERRAQDRLKKDAG